MTYTVHVPRQMSALIATGTYDLLKINAIELLSWILLEKLLNLKQILESVCQRIRSRIKQPQRIYGLPKIDKVNTPLCHVMSCVNTLPVIRLLGYIRCLESYIPKHVTRISRQNSAHFVSIISAGKIHDSLDICRRSVGVFQRSCRGSYTSSAKKVGE